MTINDLNIGDRFSFEVYPTAILGNNFRDVRLEAIVNGPTAMSFGIDVEAYHANIFPTLPAGSCPNNPYQYPYVRILMSSGEYAVLGVPWIRPETIQASAGGRVTFTFEDKTPAEIERMIMALSSNGFRPDDIQRVV